MREGRHDEGAEQSTAPFEALAVSAAWAFSFLAGNLVELRRAYAFGVYLRC